MTGKGFDFEKAVPVMRAIGLGEYRPDKGFSELMILSPGLKEPVTVPLSEILFIHSDEVSSNTLVPCYDVANKVMAFGIEESIVWHFRAWLINLDLIKKDEDQPEQSAENNATMMM